MKLEKDYLGTVPIPTLGKQSRQADRDPRVDFQTDCQIHSLGSIRTSKFITKGISESGMYVVCSEKTKHGFRTSSLVEIFLSLPDSQISFVGVPVRIEGNDIAIRISMIDDESAKKLSRFIESRNNSGQSTNVAVGYL